MSDYQHTGMTVSQRREFLKTETFIKVKWLAEKVYKNTDGSPLLSYEESTTKNRDETKQLILDFEISHGLVIPDGTEGTAAPTVAPQGETMSLPPNIPTAPSIPATPAQVAQVAAAPIPAPGVPAEQPQPTGKPGRPRKSAVGAAVAPPPAPTLPAAPGVPLQSFMSPPQVPGIGPAPVLPSSVPMVPAAPSLPSVPGVPSAGNISGPTPVQSGPQVNLSEVTSRIDQLGEMANAQNKAQDRLEENLKQLAANLTAELAYQRKLNETMFAALHHMYSVTMGQAVQGKVNTVPEFVEFMKPFIASIPK